ncbi:uncharacterized protein C8R40DRAFT_650127 [Lentinula edodes]|uniref:uncharacterized protein n=1 Tax=Lentinula edodes TaxID=5353 RepID=UPI001E8EDE53|nr:uncharacterized protein C8R40DRAFT_650127 [Lentinula edodes]KAH7870285.1 hypothetical protein C8R40DRAFT_650127 [Lentinula edodes]
MISLHHILPTLIFPLQLIQHESDEIHTTSSLRQVRSGHLQSERIIDGINFVGLVIEPRLTKRYLCNAGGAVKIPILDTGQICRGATSHSTLLYLLLTASIPTRFFVLLTSHTFFRRWEEGINTVSCHLSQTPLTHHLKIHLALVRFSSYSWWQCCASPLPAGMEGIRASQYYRRAHDTIVVDLTVAIVDRGTDVEHWGLVLGAGALNSVRAGGIQHILSSAHSYQHNPINLSSQFGSTPMRMATAWLIQISKHRCTRRWVRCGWVIVVIGAAVSMVAFHD